LTPDKPQRPRMANMWGNPGDQWNPRKGIVHSTGPFFDEAIVAVIGKIEYRGNTPAALVAVHDPAHSGETGTAAPIRPIPDELLDSFGGVHLAGIDVSPAVYADLM
jgi:hypothetical protein